MNEKNYHGAYRIIHAKLKELPPIQADTAIEYQIVDGDKMKVEFLGGHVHPRFVQMAVAMDTINLAQELLQNLGNRETIRAIGERLTRI